MVFHMGKLLADSWSVEYGSEEYLAMHRAMRRRHKENPMKFTMSPSGPACEACGDSSYTCGCPQASPPSAT